MSEDMLLPCAVALFIGFVLGVVYRTRPKKPRCAALIDYWRCEHRAGHDGPHEAMSLHWNAKAQP